MTTITTQQRESLENRIYTLLMSSDDMGMGDYGNCLDATQELVSKWMEENNITEEEN